MILRKNKRETEKKHLLNYRKESIILVNCVQVPFIINFARLTSEAV